MTRKSLEDLVLDAFLLGVDLSFTVERTKGRSCLRISAKAQLDRRTIASTRLVYTMDIADLGAASLLVHVEDLLAEMRAELRPASDHRRS